MGPWKRYSPLLHSENLCGQKRREILLGAGERVLTGFQSLSGSCKHVGEVNLSTEPNIFILPKAYEDMSYMFGGTCLGLQLKSISVFLSAANSHQYIIEFVEDGCVFTLLDILGQKYTKEEEKVQVLCLLQTISDSESKYKEIICDAHGVKAIAQCLATSESDDTLETACTLLESLSHGNPKYQHQVYKGLIALMSCTSPKAQQLVLVILNVVQSKVQTAHPSIIEPLLNMLMSLRLEVQEEAIKLILLLSEYEVRPVLFSGLVGLLKPVDEKEAQQLSIPGAPDLTHESLPLCVQQAAAAKAIRMLAQTSPDISQEMLSHHVVHHLLYAMGNRKHYDVHIQASLALEYFVNTHPHVEKHVQSCMGKTHLAAFKM